MHLAQHIIYRLLTCHIDHIFIKHAVSSLCKSVPGHKDKINLNLLPTSLNKARRNWQNTIMDEGWQRKVKSARSASFYTRQCRLKDG